MKLKIYGCRGSAAFSRVSKYGGNTSCALLESNDQVLVLDAGSGILGLEADWRKKYENYPNDLPFDINVLLSHLHMDHIMGLPLFAPLWNVGASTRIFTNSRSDMSITEQVFGMFSPPYWPVFMKDQPYVECVAVSDTFDIEGFTVTSFAANHPNQTYSFHITDGEKRVVYMLDCEMKGNWDNTKLIEHCTGADLVIFDAAYSVEDYPCKQGWGHSTVQDGVALADATGCKRMMFSHYGQEYSDEDLDRIKASVAGDDRFIFAYEGLELEI